MEVFYVPSADPTGGGTSSRLEERSIYVGMFHNEIAGQSRRSCGVPSPRPPSSSRDVVRWPRFGRDEPILADFKAGIGRLLLRSEVRLS